MPGAPSSFLFIVAMPGAPSSFLFLVVRPRAHSSILAPSSDARSPPKKFSPDSKSSERRATVEDTYNQRLHWCLIDSVAPVAVHGLSHQILPCPFLATPSTIYTSIMPKHVCLSNSFTVKTQEHTTAYLSQRAVLFLRLFP